MIDFFFNTGLGEFIKDRGRGRYKVEVDIRFEVDNGLKKLYRNKFFSKVQSVRW